jgi:hypothetical protein
MLASRSFESSSTDSSSGKWKEIPSGVRVVFCLSVRAMTRSLPGLRVHSRKAMDAAANTYIAAWKGCPVVKPAAIVPPAKA